MQDDLLAKYPDRDVSVSVVWFNMVRTDARDRWPRDEIVDGRVRHYWDEAKLVGRALAARKELVSWGPVAWDAWLLYAAGTTWDEDGPVPATRGRTIIKTREAFEREFQALPVRP